MTDRPPLTIDDIAAHQAAKGLRKYGVLLGNANLPMSALALHALEELIDLSAYLAAARMLSMQDANDFMAIADRLLPIADRPKPPPPDVPTVEAVGSGQEYWQFGADVVLVDVTPRGLRFWRPRCLGAEVVDPADPRWLGPVTLRAVRS